MRGLVALLMAIVCTVACAKRNVLGSMSIPTGSDEERMTLAKHLVVMVFSGAEAGRLDWRGAAVLVGIDDECLYAATANHLLRGDSAGPFWIRHSWASDQATRAKVLAVHDPAADVGVLCIPEPQKVMLPMPRIPFYLKGSVKELASGDTMVSIGHGNQTAWRTSAPITFDRLDGDLLYVRGGGIQPGDSGGGLFNREAAFQELVGMVRDTNEGVSTVVSVDAIGRLFNLWKLPFNLHDWNFKEFDERQAPMIRAAFRNIDSSAPPQRDGRARVERLVVAVSGGPPGAATGVLLGAGDGEIFIGVPWEDGAASGEAIVAHFANGFALAMPKPAASAGTGLVLRAPLPAADLTELLQLITGSPLQTAYVTADRLAVGRALYLAGVDREGARRILPRDHIVEEIRADQITLAAPAVSRASRGWAAFDDANNMVGIVTAVTDRTVKVRPLSAWMSQVQAKSRLEPWEPLNASIQMSVAGRPGPSSCKLPTLFRYGVNDSGQGLGRLGDTVVFSALTQLAEQQDAYVAGLSRDGKLKFVQRSDTMGSKSVQGLATDEGGVLALIGTRINQTTGIAGAEARHCGLLESMTSEGRRAKKRLSCDVPIFLPNSVRSMGTHTLVGGSLLERNDAGSSAALAEVDGDEQRPRVLAVDKGAGAFVGIVPAPGGDVFVVADGVNAASDSQDVVVARYSVAGEMRWRRFDPIPQRQEDAAAIVATGDGGLIAVGTSIRPVDRTSEVILWRYSANGDLVWKRTFGRAGLRMSALDATDDGHGGVVVAGMVDASDPGVPIIDAWLVAVDGQGQLRWQKTYAPRHVATRRVTLFKRILRDGDGFWTLADSGANAALVGTILMRVKGNGDLDTSTCSN